jgi:hypothetical protein
MRCEGTECKGPAACMKLDWVMLAPVLVVARSTAVRHHGCGCWPFLPGGPWPLASHITHASP